MLADSIAWVNSALADFGISGLALRALIEFLKQALKNSNAAVRSSATTTLVTLRLFAGAGMINFLRCRMTLAGSCFHRHQGFPRGSEPTTSGYNSN